MLTFNRGGNDASKFRRKYWLLSRASGLMVFYTHATVNVMRIGDFRMIFTFYLLLLFGGKYTNIDLVPVFVRAVSPLAFNSVINLL